MLRSHSNLTIKSTCVVLSLALSASFFSPAAVLAQGVDFNLKQGAPEPLEKEEGGTSGGAANSGAADDGQERSSVLPPLSTSSSFVVGAPQSTGADAGAGKSGASSSAVRMPEDGSDASESGLPSTASIAATGPLNLSLPTNEFIHPSEKYFKLKVSETPEISPLLSGSVQTIPDGIKVDLTMQGNLNSEVSQKGSEVFAQISRDVTDASGNKVYLPGGWVAHGFVTDRSGQGRHSKAGWAEVTFDRIISPDGKYDIPFEAKLSTKDNTVVAVTKVLATDTKYMGLGAAAGSVLSVQMTGIPLAVASHGYSVAIGAGIGAAIGLFGAMRKKGPILSVYPGEHLQLKTAGSIQMPGFNLANLPSAKKPERVVGLYMQIDEAKLLKDNFSEDKRARILKVKFTIENHSQREFLLKNMRVISELNEIYPPHANFMAVKYQPLTPSSSQTLTIPFSVDAGKHQYSLLLTDARGREVRREPIKLD
ncbi:MAG: TrbI/VirB10 family protein [Cyanobacteria bacterium SZAS TMP-1]|nr:TrbI/VirB10 family protein [Cyanobacteria bacterium SZAS TMP-1]